MMLVPREQPARWLPHLARGLQDDDPHVRARSINASTHFRGPDLVPFLLAAMEHERDPTRCAEAIGRIAGRTQEALAWIHAVEHVTVRFATTNGMSALFRTLGVPGVRCAWSVGEEPDGDGRHVLAQRLRAFVRARRVAIEGGPLGLPDATWPLDLLPDGWRIELPDGGTWPPGRP